MPAQCAVFTYPDALYIQHVVVLYLYSHRITYAEVVDGNVSDLDKKTAVHRRKVSAVHQRTVAMFSLARKPAQGPSSVCSWSNC